MRFRRTLLQGLLMALFVFASYLYEGRERPVWQREVAGTLMFSGFCDDERHFAVMDLKSQPPRLERYEVATGELVSSETLAELDTTLNWGHISRDGEWLYLCLPTPDDEDLRFAILHRTPRNEDVLRPFRRVNRPVGNGFFSADSRWFASYDYRSGEVSVFDLKTDEIVERHKLSEKEPPTGDWGYVRFTADPDWLLIVRNNSTGYTRQSYRRSTKAAVTLGDYRGVDGFQDPRAMRIVKTNKAVFGKWESSLSRIDVTVDPPRETPLPIHFPYSVDTPSVDRLGNIVIGEEIADRWRLGRRMLETIFRGRIPPPKWMQCPPETRSPWIISVWDAQGKQIGDRRTLPVYDGLHPTAGKYLVNVTSVLRTNPADFRKTPGTSTITVWPFRVSPRRWTWVILGLTLAVQSVSHYRCCRKPRRNNPEREWPGSTLKNVLHGPSGSAK